MIYLTIFTISFFLVYIILNILHSKIKIDSIDSSEYRIKAIHEFENIERTRKNTEEAVNEFRIKAKEIKFPDNEYFIRFMAYCSLKKNDTNDYNLYFRNDKALFNDINIIKKGVL